MTGQTDTDTMQVLAWAVDRLQPSKTRTALSKLLHTLEAAQHLTDTVTERAHSDKEARSTALQAARAELAREPRQANLQHLCDVLTHAQAADALHAIEEREAATVTANLKQAAAATFRAHALELLPLVTAERCREVTRCGSDTVAAEARFLWAALNVQLHPQLPNELVLPQAMRNRRTAIPNGLVPLTWQDHEPATLRASLAWLWLALDARDFVQVTAPLSARQASQGMPRDTNGKCLRVTAIVEVLPTVPQAVPRLLKRMQFFPA